MLSNPPLLLKHERASQGLFILAAWYDCGEACASLLEHGLSPNIKDYNSLIIMDRTLKNGSRAYSPLIAAATRGNVDTVRILIQDGADLNICYCSMTAVEHLLLALEKESF
ncbi:hypothetical protein B0H67DRAFT_647360 [Lasiosphaeris hirsuta]|uniref:Ankyrin repeat protein n=1 Tax=Lasiosphaeris hirsuta TaxID=260670 RepID=A0AA40AA27_9PEZI|nr:hypothetical protein B0H67DRAFT_647360 [Lasiosphaeris hirsuta]